MELSIAATLYFSFCGFLVFPLFGAPALFAKMAIALCGYETVTATLWAAMRDNCSTDGCSPLLASLSSLAGLDRKVSDHVRTNIHITSSGMCNPALLRHVLEVTTPDRLFFSTDYPFQRPDRTDIEKFLTEFPTDEDRDKFTAGNACSLFGIDITCQKEQR